MFMGEIRAILGEEFISLKIHETWEGNPDTERSLGYKNLSPRIFKQL